VVGEDAVREREPAVLRQVAGALWLGRRRIAAATLALGAAVAFATIPAYSSFDSIWSLVWGQEIAHGARPSFERAQHEEDVDGEQPRRDAVAYERRAEPALARQHPRVVDDDQQRGVPAQPFERGHEPGATHGRPCSSAPLTLASSALRR
jgi:hypothetical protein